MSHIWMSHITHMNESCRTYQWVISQLYMSHTTHITVPCHTWVMWHDSQLLSRVMVSRDYLWSIAPAPLCTTCDMMRLCVWHDSFTRVIWLIHMCDVICVTFVRVHMCDIRTCDITHACLWHDSQLQSRVTVSRDYLWSIAPAPLCTMWCLRMPRTK